MKSILETLVKVAYDLDRQEKYSEADKIEEAIKILQQRVGLDVVSDMVSLADDLDQAGDTKNAEQLDLAIQKLAEIQKTAVCPQCGNDEYYGGTVCDDCGYPYVKEKREPMVKTKKPSKTCPLCGTGKIGYDGMCDKCSPIEDIGWGGEEDLGGGLTEEEEHRQAKLDRLLLDENMGHEAYDELLNKLIRVANGLDDKKLYSEADEIDDLVSKVVEAKTKYKTWKGKGEKPPKGAEHKAPKGWFDEMKEKTKKKNPDYSDKRVNEIVGDIWDNQLSDAKRKAIYKKYNKKGDPNK